MEISSRFFMSFRTWRKKPWGESRRGGRCRRRKSIKAPYLILHGTEDGAVDWIEGLGYYNTGRRLGKEVILLSYPGEGHHLRKVENQKDFQIRMKQFFDHYLKDVPAPTWMTEGVPFLEKDRIGPEDGVGGGG